MTQPLKTVVRPTRRVRDLLRRQRFTAVKRFPGGREITIGTAETRRRALKKAQYANRPNGSPTAGGSYTPGYAPGSEAGGGAGLGDAGTINQYR